MTTMREKMARSLCMKKHYDPDEYPDPEEGPTSFYWKLYLPEVDALLDTMMRPDDAMMFAGGNAEDCTEIEKPSAFRARIVWKAMLTTIKEGGE